MFPKVLKVATRMEIHTKKRGKDLVSVCVLRNFLLLLSRALNFRWEVIKAKEEFSRLVNGSWTGTLGLLQRREADMVVDYTALSPFRMEHFNHSYPFALHPLGFIAQTPEFSKRADAMLSTFTLGLWLSVLAALMLAPFVFRETFRLQYSFGRIATKVFGSMLNQSTGFRVKSMARKILCGSWYVSVYILSLSYSAVLLSVITMPHQEKPLKNVRDLAAALGKGTYTFVIEPSMEAVLNTVFDRSEDDFLKTSYDVIRNSWVVREKFSISDFLTLPKAVTATDDYNLESRSHAYAAFEEPLHRFAVSIVFRDGFCYKESVNRVIHRMWAAGLFRKIESDAMFTFFMNDDVVHVYPEDSESSHNKQLSLGDLWGGFLVLITGCVVSFAVVVMELCHYRIKKCSAISHFRRNK